MATSMHPSAANDKGALAEFADTRRFATGGP